MPTNFQISPVNQTPAHELVADQLQRAIMLGRYLPGDKLPPERAMAEQFNVSRTSVREAIHILVEYGLLEIKRGATGGAIVQNMIEDGVREQMRSFALARKKDYKELLDFRLVVECAAAGLAASNRTKKDLKGLSRHVDQMDAIFDQADTNGDGPIAIRFYALDTAFHIAIAKASGNQHIAECVEECRYKMFMPLGRVVAEIDTRANDMHHELYAAIEAQDSEAAAQTMRNHIQESFNSVFGD
jgi:GntR family transcriptional repressor for pyruvate dehydrogenase complex